MVKDTNTRVTFTCTKKVARFIKHIGGSKFIIKCIADYAFYSSDIPLNVWRDLFLEFDFID